MSNPCDVCGQFERDTCNKCVDFNDWIPNNLLAPVICKIRAIERERCAKICEGEARECSESAFTSEAIIAADAATQCAERIREVKDEVLSVL